MKKKIDINVDLGEGAGFDEILMPLVSSCSIACGGHYGNELSMSQTIKLAKTHRVKIGAHPSYPDPHNFGRKVMELSLVELKQSIINQLNSFFDIACQLQVEVHHIKLHGALYNEAAKDPKIARMILQALDELQLNCALYVPFGSEVHIMADGAYNLRLEAFIDRRYNSDLTLVPRSHPSAMIVDKEEAWKQLQQMIFFGNVNTIDNVIAPINADTYCIHGDTNGAVDILKFIRQKLTDTGISL